MLIQCTKKLLDELEVKPIEVPEEDPLFSWHANLVTVDRRKAVVLMNNKNNFIVVLNGLTTEDFGNLGEHILNAIRESFKDESIEEEAIEKYINQEIVYSKTSSRSIISKLNYACSLLPQSINQGALSVKLSNYPFKNGTSMCKDLEVLASQDIIFDYLRALSNLYGVVSMEKVVEIFNMQNDDKISVKDIEEVLKSRTLEKERFAYSMGYIVEESILYSNYLNELLSLQEGKAYYIPNKHELLKYTDQFYFEVTDEFNRLKEFIKRNFELNDVILEGLCEDIQIRCASITFSIDNIINELNRRNLTFNNKIQVTKFIDLVMELTNNTRMWANTGFTANEMNDDLHKTTGTKMIDMPNIRKANMRISKKIGRNDPCPCGSGIKYKKCCLRKPSYNKIG